jgi:hypothetical protein
MNEARKGQIAIAMLKSIVREKGIHNLKPNSVRREAGNLAKELGVPEDEIFQFLQIITGELISEAMGKQLQWGDDLPK